MRGYRVIVPAGIALAGLAGTALAAHPSAHRMNVALPGGGMAVIDYRGDVAPRVGFAPAPGYGPAAFAGVPAFPGLGWLDDFAALDQQFDAMIRQANALAAPPAAGTPQASFVSFGAMPPGTTSYSVVSVTTPSGTCVKTVETRSMGPGKPPSTTVKTSGDCATASAAPAPAPAPVPKGSAAPAPVDDSRPVSHT